MNEWFLSAVLDPVWIVWLEETISRHLSWIGVENNSRKNFRKGIDNKDFFRIFEMEKQQKTNNHEKLKTYIMNYIKSSEEITLTLNHFYCQTAFCVRSKDNNYKICHIYLHNYYCSNDGITTIEVSVWDSLHGYGRHKLTIEEVTDHINMKELLMEISATFANHEFTMNECYVEMSVPKENGRTIEITF